MRFMILLVGLASSAPVFSADLVNTNAGVVPAGLVAVVQTNGNQLYAEVAVTNTFTEAVECRVYVMPSTNSAEVSIGPIVVAWSVVPPSEYGHRSWIYPPSMAFRYGIGTKVEIGGSQKSTILVGPGSPGLSLTNENVLVIQYLPPGVKEETARSKWSLCQVLTAAIGKGSRAEPTAPPNAAEPRR